MPRAVFLGQMATLDATLDAALNAKKDWIKNDRVKNAINRAIREIQIARGHAAGDINKSLDIEVRID